MMPGAVSDSAPESVGIGPRVGALASSHLEAAGEHSLSFGAGVRLLGVALALNSLFAILGSLMWGVFPYWPAYMVSTLITAYFGWWGVALAALSPIASSFLGVNDAPFYLYPAADVLQMSIVRVAFQWLRIPPHLPALSHKIKYVLFAVLVPCICGGTLAWWLRSLYSVPEEPSLGQYTFDWTLENLLPVLFPGIWLHKVVGELYRPFEWETGGRSRSWVRSAVYHSLPWVISLATVGAMLVLSVMRVLGLDFAGLAAPGAWARVSKNVVSEIPGFPLTVLALTISFLCSLGFSVRFAKQAWVLSEAVRRHFPNKRISDLLLSGISVPPEEKLVSVVIVSIQSFESVADRLGARDTVLWLNEFLSYTAEVCRGNGGSVDKLLGDSVSMVFGLSGGAHARSAVKCALDLRSKLDELNQRLGGLPPMNLGVSVHSGAIIAGELGPPVRRAYSVVGGALRTCRRLHAELRNLPSGFVPVLVSRECMREAGLLERSAVDTFVEMAIALAPGEPPREVYGIERSGVAKCLSALGPERLEEARRSNEPDVFVG